MQDVRLSATGELLVANGDLDLTTNEDYLLQQVRWRLQSARSDLPYSPNLAANLFDLRGQPNTVELANTGETRIIKALTFDGLIETNALYVRGAPTKEGGLIWFVFINMGDRSEGFAVDLNMDRGVIVKGVRD
jgi:hypothetical protein